MGSFVVVDVGCLECGYASEALGVYGSLEAALTAHPEANYVQSDEDVKFSQSQLQVLRVSG